MEDCDLRSPRYENLNVNETPRGTEFVQLDFDAVALAGGASADAYAMHRGQFIIPQSPQQIGLEECHIRTPKGDFVQTQQTPKGTEFAQLNTDSAINTGGIMNDLKRFENEWDTQLDSKVNDSAQTPRQNNLEKFKKPSRNVIYGCGGGGDDACGGGAVAMTTRDLHNASTPKQNNTSPIRAVYGRLRKNQQIAEI